MKKNYAEPEIEILFLNNSSESGVFTDSGLQGGDHFVAGDSGIDGPNMASLEEF